MRQSTGWGLVIGAVVAVATWIGEPRESGVSLFPDFISLIVFAALAAFAFDRLLRHANKWKEVIGAVTAFGVSAGIVLGVATLQRGAMVWSGFSLPLAVATVVGSLVTIVLLSCSIGILTFSMRLRRERVSV